MNENVESHEIILPKMISFFPDTVFSYAVLVLLFLIFLIVLGWKIKQIRLKKRREKIDGYFESFNIENKQELVYEFWRYAGQKLKAKGKKKDHMNLQRLYQFQFDLFLQTTASKLLTEQANFNLLSNQLYSNRNLTIQEFTQIKYTIGKWVLFHDAN